MTATLLTQAPTFHSLNGRQAVGRRQIATSAEYAGTVAVLYRAADAYWTVTTRSAVRAFTTESEAGVTVAIWFDRAEGRYVVDYTDRCGVRVEAGRTWGLGAAIGIATSASSHLWAQSR